jgi:hypothetical protein
MLWLGIARRCDWHGVDGGVERRCVLGRIHGKDPVLPKDYSVIISHCEWEATGDPFLDNCIEAPVQSLEAKRCELIVDCSRSDSYFIHFVGQRWFFYTWLAARQKRNLRYGHRLSTLWASLEAARCEAW